MTVLETRIDRLITASQRRVIEPDAEVAGAVGPGAVLPRELLSVRDLDVELTDEQAARLSREELASLFDNGIRFELVLMAGFALMLSQRPDLTDPRVTYVLHEIGEETRHSRLFARVIGQLEPQAENVFLHPVARAIDRFVNARLIQRRALFCLLVLAGEEGPDLLQKRSSEHPDTDPFVREVNRYHRGEEARHLAFARAVLPELWAEAPAAERWLARHVGPALIGGLFDGLVQPGVYRTVGLPGWRTWLAVRRSPTQSRLRAEALRPVLHALQTTGALRRVPRSWRRACQVDRRGRPLPVARSGGAHAVQHGELMGG